MSVLAKYAIYIVLGLAAIGVSTFAIQSCRDTKDSESVVVSREWIKLINQRIISDSVALAEKSRHLDAALSNGVQIVERWRESAPRPIPTGTTRDTIIHLSRQVRECRDAGDSLVESVVRINSACTAYRDTATKSIAGLKSGIAHRDSLIEKMDVVKRVQPYGAALYDLGNRRPVFRVGSTAKGFWKIHGMAEAEYAVPSAVKTESGDGLRVLGGLRINF